jgi:hypothetical protein
MMNNTDSTKTSEGHKTQDEDKQTIEHNTPQESKMMNCSLICLSSSFVLCPSDVFVESVLLIILASCVVFCSLVCLSSSCVLCTQCCQCPWNHKTKDEDKQIKEHNTTHESKMMSNTDPTKTSGGHKKQDEDKQTKQHNTTQETKMMSNTTLQKPSF